MSRRRHLAVLALIAGALALLAAQGGSAAPHKGKPKHPVKHKPKPKPKPKPLTAQQRFAKVKRVVVIYEENHSFDNLYGGWEGVNGLASATPTHTTQINQAGTPFTCLLQLDVNLTSPPQDTACSDATTATPFTSHFVNAPFAIDDFITPADTTCPPPPLAFSFPNGVKKGAGLPGGCTRDLVHVYYIFKFQVNGGK
jgi:phospholipase C